MFLQKRNRMTENHYGQCYKISSSGSSQKVQFFIYIEYKNGSVLSLENLAEFLFSGNDYILWDISAIAIRNL